MAVSYNTSIVRDGLVLHLDATNVKSYVGSGTNWKNLSGSNNGSLVNGVTYNSNGYMTFDGTNDNVTLSSSIPGDGQISFFGWVYRNNSTTTDVIFGTLGKYSGLLFTTDGRLNFQTAPGGTFQIETSASTISNATWYYVGVTRGATTDRLYLNSIEVASGTVTKNRSFAIDYLGVTNGIADYFGGRMSNMTVYNRELSATEIKRNFESLRGRYGI